MWPNAQFPADLVTFTEEILNVKRHFLSRVWAILMLDILILTPFGTHLVEEDLNISSVINCLFPS